MKKRALVGTVAVAAVAVAIAAAVVIPQLARSGESPASVSIVPRPAHLEVTDDRPFEFSGRTELVVSGDGLGPVAEYLKSALDDRGHHVEIGSGELAEDVIVLDLEPALDVEAYTLESNADGITITAGSAAGAFWATQTLRQLVSASNSVPAVAIEDAPRFAYRGAMLDVARHFFPVDAVERYIDDLALLKINHLHLHLTDDQGWRLQIQSRPLLTEIGGQTAVGAGEGGYYTQDDYRELVAYAQSRFITIVPEIDVPGHTNAALASYGELNPDGQPADPYTGIEVGFSTLDANSETTYAFLEDVFREVAELTPGPYLHIGGDESRATSDEDFQKFVARAAEIAAGTGKTVVGWHEMGASTELPPGTIGQYWNYTTPETAETADHAVSFVDQGGRLIMSPANVAYLDMKYDDATPLGLTWAQGFTSVEEAYSWDPAAVLPGVGDAEILGVEAPLWSETLVTIEDVEYMAFPRIASLAEVSWSPQEQRDVDDFAARLGTFGALLDDLGIRYNGGALP